MFLLGIRNTQGFDWLDRGTMVITDHGPSGELGRFGHDEVNIARAGDDLGWPGIYGCQRAPWKITPLLSWEEAVPPGGGDVTTGPGGSETTQPVSTMPTNAANTADTTT